MATRIPSDPRERVDFSKIDAAIPIPNLIEVQKRSYERFLQMHTAPADRDVAGLQGVFKSIFPIKDFRETCSLEFVDYTIGNWECKCGELQGIENLRSECQFCGHRLIAPDARGGEAHCSVCGNQTRVEVRDCATWTTRNSAAACRNFAVACVPVGVRTWRRFRGASPWSARRRTGFSVSGITTSRCRAASVSGSAW